MRQWFIFSFIFIEVPPIPSVMQIFRYAMYFDFNLFLLLLLSVSSHLLLFIFFLLLIES